MQEWLTVAIGLLNLAAVAWGAIKIVNRNGLEWRDRELRLLALEAEMASYRGLASKIAEMSVKLNEVSAELLRLRERLERLIEIKVHA